MTIHIEDLRFEAIIGILESERLCPQIVSLHVTITYDYNERSFIDYANVCSLIETHMQTAKYFLLEEAIEGIYAKVLHFYPFLTKITIKITKPTILPNALVGVSHTFKTSEN